MKSFSKLLGKVKNKIVLIRLDLNVPLVNNKIVDTTRIDKIIGSLNLLLKEEAKIIIVSHVGRPYGKKIEKLSLIPVAKCLEIKINKKVELIYDNILNLNKSSIKTKFDNNILMLENIRFYPEEETNDSFFAGRISKLADFYVNEAFSCSHRKHASVVAITKFIDSYAGLLFEQEVKALKKITTNITKPITCIIGGSKISSKIKIIENLIPKLNNIVVVGGMANNFFKFNNKEIGKSIYEKNINNTIKRIFNLSIKYDCKIILPRDVKVGKNFESTSENKDLSEIRKEDIILDIGNKSVSAIEAIIKKSKTVLWNGPAGYFENQNFSNGSEAIAKIISSRSKANRLFSVVGGGDTVAVINKKKLFEDFNFVSTAGGAFLEYLEGIELPGIKALD